MDKQELLDKVKTLMEDETFTAKLAAANSLDEVAAAFQKEGIEVTGADLEAAAASKQSGAELDENALDQVAGGSWISVGVAIVKYLAEIHGPIRPWWWNRNKSNR